MDMELKFIMFVAYFTVLILDVAFTTTTTTTTTTAPPLPPPPAAVATQVLSWQQHIENTGVDLLCWVSVFEREGQNIHSRGVTILSYSLWTFTVKHHNLCTIKTCSFLVSELLCLTEIV